MVKSCCIKGCNVSSPDVEYYKFPLRGALLTAWVTATGASSGDVCSAHFTGDDYKSVRGKRRLLHTAVPSVLCKPPSTTENGEISSTNTDTPRKNNKKHVKVKAKNKRAKGRKKIIDTDADDSDNDKETVSSKYTEDKTKETIDKKKTVSSKDTEDKTKETVDKKKTVSSKDTEDKTKETIDKKKTVSSKETEDKTKETIDKNRVATDKNGAIEKTNSDRESSQDSVDTRQSNGKEMGGKGKEQNAENAQTEINDIEDMITNYQIKQVKTLADRLNPEPLEDLIPAILARAHDAAIQNDVQNTSQQSQPAEPRRVDAGQLASHLSNKLDERLAQMRTQAPVFIEVAVEQGIARAESPQDCVMLLESVQCDIDPSSLMLPEHGPETDSDMEIVEPDPPKKEDPRKEDPISLLTSSDEDDVILEEPHIDTVEVSDETDEDDKPLQTLIRAGKPKANKKKGSCDWAFKEYQCVQCEFKTNDGAEFKQHNKELGHVRSTTIQVCPTCNYTTASKAQFSRHKRKHKDERNFKCHLCNYKARHNMSLIYHLKCHAAEKDKKKSEKFTCDKCGFSSNVKSEALSHLKQKACDGNKYACDACSYSTKRRSDLRRHRLRKHSVDDSDEDFVD